MSAREPQVFSEVVEFVRFAYRPLDWKQFPVVFVLDLDKTYLDTQIESIRGLWRAFIERSINKTTVMGVDWVLLRLKARYQERYGLDTLPLFFVTASPPQMEEAIREKFLYDGILPLGCYFKDNWRNLRIGRWRYLYNHIGFKIQSLLDLRQRLAPDVVQFLWGDDSENDAIIYNLYSDICGKRLKDDRLRMILERFHVRQSTLWSIMGMAPWVSTGDPVSRIYIHLAYDTDAAYYGKFGGRTLAVSNALQVALDLWAQEWFQLDDVGEVVDRLLTAGLSVDQINESLYDFVHRRYLSPGNLYALVDFWKSQGWIKWVNWELWKPASQNLPWIIEKIDYLRDYG